jgi:hypothetical protein
LAKVKAKGLTHGFLLDWRDGKLLKLAMRALTTEANALQKRRTKSTA